MLHVGSACNGIDDWGHLLRLSVCASHVEERCDGHEARVDGSDTGAISPQSEKKIIHIVFITVYSYTFYSLRRNNHPKSY